MNFPIFVEFPSAEHGHDMPINVTNITLIDDKTYNKGTTIHYNGGMYLTTLSKQEIMNMISIRVGQAFESFERIRNKTRNMMQAEEQLDTGKNVVTASGVGTIRK